MEKKTNEKKKKGLSRLIGIIAFPIGKISSIHESHTANELSSSADRL
jgi:hypothetical protein